MNSDTSLAQNVFRILLGLSLFFAGLAHLTFSRAEFQAQVPDWVPVSKDVTVILSGIVEIGLGLLLLLATRYRKTVGWIVAVFFVLVFPGNLAQYLNGVDAFGLDSDWKRLARLFFQPFLVLWALWGCGVLGRKPR